VINALRARKRSCQVTFDGHWHIAFAVRGMAARKSFNKNKEPEAALINSHDPFG